MDIKEIKQIVDLMKRSDLTEFEIEEKDLKLRICRQGKDAVVEGMPPAMAVPPAPATPAPPAQTNQAPQPAGTPPEDDDAVYIKSPMVGTFYQAPSPDSPPFVEKGARVTRETVVCIIEAMKVMNEIQAEVSGTIAEVLVENGDPVEYGQPLFKIRNG
ncbi:MAG: acetyl-CoA carboxylase biotin carboxyl carrier protein [Opitutales bacterium]